MVDTTTMIVIVVLEALILSGFWNLLYIILGVVMNSSKKKEGTKVIDFSKGKVIEYNVLDRMKDHPKNRAVLEEGLKFGMVRLYRKEFMKTFPIDLIKKEMKEFTQPSGKKLIIYGISKLRLVYENLYNRSMTELEDERLENQILREELIKLRNQYGDEGWKFVDSFIARQKQVSYAFVPKSSSNTKGGGGYGPKNN